MGFITYINPIRHGWLCTHIMKIIKINRAHANMKQYGMTADLIYYNLISLSISFLIYVFIIREVQGLPNDR